jgi:hypothetical protein
MHLCQLNGRWQHSTLYFLYFLAEKSDLGAVFSGIGIDAKEGSAPASTAPYLPDSTGAERA